MSDTNPSLDFTTGIWCSVEIMGYVHVYGIVTEEEHFGAKLCRIEIPISETEWRTQFVGGSSIYRLSPCDEETARKAAGYRRPAISQWTGRAVEPPSYPPSEDDPDLGDDFNRDDDPDDDDELPDGDEILEGGQRLTDTLPYLSFPQQKGD
jgi:hypothetical protein